MVYEKISEDISGVSVVNPQLYWLSLYYFTTFYVRMNVVLFIMFVALQQISLFVLF